MNYNNYFKALERCYQIQLDSTIRNTMINHFKDELYLFTEQDMYEQTRKIVNTYIYSKTNSKYKKQWL